MNMDRKRIGIKYCGGCNPTYERVELTRRLEGKVGERFYFVRHDERELHALLLVSGCETACADENLVRADIPRLSITSSSDFGRIVDWLQGL